MDKMKFIFLAAIFPLIIFSLDYAFEDSEQTDEKSIFDLLFSSPECSGFELEIPENS